jgi:hypothetical protein
MILELFKSEKCVDFRKYSDFKIFKFKDFKIKNFVD